jgi:hypothetical protein
MQQNQLKFFKNNWFNFISLKPKKQNQNWKKTKLNWKKTEPNWNQIH